MRKNSIETLHWFRDTAESLGYSTELTSKSEEVPYDELSVMWDDAEGDEQLLTLIIFPLGEDLDGSIFIQFYSEYPFTIQERNLSRVVTNLPMVNNKLPLGHFDISQDKETLYFRYVLAFPMDYAMISPGFLNDVLDMCIYAYEGFRDGFRTLCTADP